MTQLIFQEGDKRALWVPRSTWGASAGTEAWLDRRAVTTRELKTEVHVHHTAAVDRLDDTPNLWELKDAMAYMRRLEIVRPDLGPLPYSENVALSEDLKTVWFLEGRGLTKVGAHTGGHNLPGIGWSFLGDFRKTDGLAELKWGLRALALRLHDLRHNKGFVRLGDTKSPNEWDVWGHRDTKSTSCPGKHLYTRLADVQFVDDWQEDDMLTKTQARLEVAAAFGEELGVLPTASAAEDAQKRLTRIADQLFDGTRTPDQLRITLRAFAPSDLAARKRASFEAAEIPAWVLIEGVPATNAGLDSEAVGVDMTAVFAALAERLGA